MYKELLSLAATATISVCAMGSASIAAAASDKGTIAVGYTNSGVCQGPTHLPIPFFGYHEELSTGSYSPTRLTGGGIVSYLGDQISFDSCATGGTFSVLGVSGFSSNPGRRWLRFVECAGITNGEASAFQFTYRGGTALWYWSSLFGLKSKDDSNANCTIVHD
jgi:hypothetical protein